MRLIHKDDKSLVIDILLKPKSLYILKLIENIFKKTIHLFLFLNIYFRNLVRFDFTHEILKDQESYFNDIHIPRNRRISIISRNMPLDPTAG